MSKRLGMGRFALALLCTVIVIIVLELNTNHRRLREHLSRPMVIHGRHINLEVEWEI